MKLQYLLFVTIILFFGSNVQAQHYQKMNHQFTSKKISEEAPAFLKEKFKFLTQTDCDLIETENIESPGGFHITFRQSYKNLPITNSYIKLNILKSGKILSALNFLNNSEISPITFPENSQSAKNYVAQIKNVKSYDIKEAFYFQDNQLLPVYEIFTTGDGTDGTFYIILDANNLTEIHREIRSVYHHFATDTGKGKVFNPDPLTSAGVTYGGQYVDNNDADNTVLNNELIDVDLLGIDSSGGVFSLIGPYVKIEDIENPTVAPVTSTDGNFFYTRSQSGFEDVMVYYHIDHFQRYIQTLGFTNLANLPLRIDPHGMGGADNSVFMPSGSSSYLSFGEGGVDDAEDADVIIHEYGHALSYFAAPSTNTGTERHGLDEGIGDYFASSYSRQVNPFNWEKIYTWDGNNGGWQGREANSTQTYPISSSNIYEYGTIWVSTMMEVFTELGAEITDKLQLQELYMNTSGISLADAALLTLDADTALFSGFYSPILIKYFCNRGLITGQLCALASTNENLDLSSTVTIFPNPNNGSFQIQLDNPQEIEKIEAFDLLGKKVYSQKKLIKSDLNLRLNLKGVYLLKITTKSQQQIVKKVIIQ